MRLYKLLGWVSLVVACSLVAYGLSYDTWGREARPVMNRLIGGMTGGVVIFWVLYAIYWEIKERCKKKEREKPTPQKVIWFLRWAELTFPLTFVLVCIVGIMVWESTR